MRTRWAAADMAVQQGRTALVTGANSGIGFHQALELARHGACVLLACRDPGRGEAAGDAIKAELPAASVELVALDLADLDSVARLADQLLGRDGGLDLLINNAGVMAVPRRRTWESWPPSSSARPSRSRGWASSSGGALRNGWASPSG